MITKKENLEIIRKEKKIEMPDWSKKQVLIGEDKASNYKVIDKTLVITRIKILWAVEGLQALDLFKKEKKIFILFYWILNYRILVDWRQQNKLKLKIQMCPLLPKLLMHCLQKNTIYENQISMIILLSLLCSKNY